jgi:hypothetical protein
MAIWKTGQPPFLAVGHKIKINYAGAVVEAEVTDQTIETGSKARITAAPAGIVGKTVKVTPKQVLAWQPLKAKLEVHL